MPRCCKCNSSSGSCISRSCVRADKRCVDCLCGQHGRCQNTPRAGEEQLRPHHATVNDGSQALFSSPSPSTMSDARTGQKETTGWRQDTPLAEERPNSPSISSRDPNEGTLPLFSSSSSTSRARTTRQQGYPPFSPPLFWPTSDVTAAAITSRAAAPGADTNPDEENDDDAFTDEPTVLQFFTPACAPPAFAGETWTGTTFVTPSRLPTTKQFTGNGTSSSPRLARRGKSSFRKWRGSFRRTPRAQLWNLSH